MSRRPGYAGSCNAGDALAGYREYWAPHDQRCLANSGLGVCHNLRVEDTAAVTTVRAFYAAIGDRPYEETIAPFLAEEIVWQVSGINPLAGTFSGIPAVLDAMRSFGAASRGSLELNTRTLMGDEHHVVAVHDASARLGDHAYAAHEVDVFHVSTRRITRFWSFSEDQAATDRMWILGAGLIKRD